MARLLLVVALLVGLVYLLRHFNSLDQAGRKRFWKQFAFFLLLGFVVMLTVTGRLHYIAAIVTAALPFGKKLLPFLRYVPVLRNLYQQSKAGAQSQAGQRSKVTTSLLEMELDHDSASLDGKILAGMFTGNLLSQLSQSQLLQLYKEACRDYRDSVELLEAFLQRELGDDWQDFKRRQQQDEGSPSGGSQEMSLDDAYEVLGLEKDASRDEVIQAHRRLMQKFHPDRGGNDFLAAQINRAKQIVMDAIESA